METLFAVTGLLFHWKDELAEVSSPSVILLPLFLAPQQCWEWQPRQLGCRNFWDDGMSAVRPDHGCKPTACWMPGHMWLRM